MPNWCNNTLTIEGNQRKLDEIRERARGTVGGDPSDFSLNRFIPISDEDPNWYDKRIRDWGTKWDVIADLQTSVRHLMYVFDSAWNPPIEAIEKISFMHPTLTFTLEYEEPRNAFQGKRVFHSGICIDEIEEDMVFTTCNNCGDDCYITLSGCCSCCGERIRERKKPIQDKKPVQVYGISKFMDKINRGGVK